MRSPRRLRWLGLLAAGLLLALLWPREAAQLGPGPAAEPAGAGAARPAPSATPAPGAAVQHAAPALKLLGTTLTSDGAMALVRRAGDARALALRVGDEVDGLVVRTIESGRVKLARVDAAADAGAAGLVIETERPGSTAHALPAMPAAPAVSARANLPAPTSYAEPDIVVEGH